MKKKIRLIESFKIILFCLAAFPVSNLKAQTFDTLNFSNQFNFNPNNPPYFTPMPTGNVVFNSTKFYLYPWTDKENGWWANNVVGSNPIKLKLLCNRAISTLNLLANTTWGQSGPSTISVQFWKSGAIFFTKALFGNSDIRDYYQNVYTNAINNTTTKNAYTSASGSQRIDHIRIDLPTRAIIDSILIVDNGASNVQRIFVLAATVQTEALLPLNFLSFSAKIKNTLVLLNWQTANETNSDKFIVQKSDDGAIFKEVGVVVSMNGVMNDYSFTDEIKNSENRVLYYRLQQVDKDGKFTYSNILKVKVSNATKAKIFPNPVMSKTTIQIESQYKDPIKIIILSSDGKLILTKTLNLLPGNNLIPLNTQRLTTGIYTVIITGQNTNERLNFTK